MSRNSKMNLYARKNSNPSRGNFPQTWEVIDGNGSGWFYIVTIPQGGTAPVPIKNKKGAALSLDGATAKEVMRAVDIVRYGRR